MPRPLILLRLENLRAEKTIVVGHRQPIGNFWKPSTILIRNQLKIKEKAQKSMPFTSKTTTLNKPFSNLGLNKLMKYLFYLI